MKDENLKLENQKPIKSPEEIRAEYLEDCRIAEDNTILRVVAGSRAYGTQLPTSDYDERGIFIDIPQRVILPFQKLEQVKLEKDDVVLFELSKYMQLLTEQNPNIMEIVWTVDEDVVYSNNAGKFLLENRSLFLSQDVKNSYTGYALSQLRRIQGHNTWINNPQPEEAPKLMDYISVVYNLSSDATLNKSVAIDHSQYKALKLKDGIVALFDKRNLNVKDNGKGWIDRLGNPAFSSALEIKTWCEGNDNKPSLLVKLNKEAYENSMKNHRDYWNWKTSRNEVRSKLEEAHGYDTKHAMHLIRLLRSGADILEHGVVPVRRTDAQELLDIRHGKFTYDELLKEADKLKEKIVVLSEKSKLPKTVDVNLLKEFMFDMYKKHWEENGLLKSYNNDSTNVNTKIKMR